MADLSVSSVSEIITELCSRETFGGVVVQVDLTAPTNRSAVITNHVSDTLAPRGRRVAEVLMQAAGQVETAGL